MKAYKPTSTIHKNMAENFEVSMVQIASLSSSISSPNFFENLNHELSPYSFLKTAKVAGQDFFYADNYLSCHFCGTSFATDFEQRCPCCLASSPYNHYENSRQYIECTQYLNVRYTVQQALDQFSELALDYKVSGKNTYTFFNELIAPIYLLNSHISDQIVVHPMPAFTSSELPFDFVNPFHSANPDISFDGVVNQKSRSWNSYHRCYQLLAPEKHPDFIHEFTRCVNRMKCAHIEYPIDSEWKLIGIKIYHYGIISDDGIFNIYFNSVTGDVTGIMPPKRPTLERKYYHFKSKWGDRYSSFKHHLYYKENVIYSYFSKFISN